MSHSRASAVSAEAQAVLDKHARSFRWAQVFLGSTERADSAIAYAFCRLVDDSADEAPSPAHGAQALRELEAMIHGKATPSPLVSAYVELAERRGFGLGPALALLRGARSDLELVRVESDEELLSYCYRVAGTVGLMMAGILGTSQAEAGGHASDLGIAMQLTNICRDVREDAQRGRVYLPRLRLAAAGVDPEALVSGHASDDPRLRSGVAAVVFDLLEMADSYYARGREGFPFLPVRARLAIAVAAELYQGIGHRLRDRYGSDSLRGRVQVPALVKTKLCISATAGWLTTLAPAAESSISLAVGAAQEQLLAARSRSVPVARRIVRAATRARRHGR